MKVIVALMVVALLWSTSTLEYCEAIASKELCEQIRSNEHRILTMGARGRTLADAHFYILVEGGYMFKVPLSNLRVDEANKTTSITIDENHIRADALFNVSRDVFTQMNRFFLISNKNQDAFLGQMFISKVHNQSTFQLYDLNGVLSSGESAHHIRTRLEWPIQVMSSIGNDSNTTHSFELISNKIFYRLYIFEVVHQDELKVTQTPFSHKFVHKFSRTTDIVTVFYHQENLKQEAGYYYFLDAEGLLTVSRRINVWDGNASERFKVNLSSFVVCHFKQTTTNLPTSSWTYWIMALCFGVIVVLGGLAVYFYVGMKKEKAKRKDKKKKNRPNMSNLSSSSFVSSNLSSSNVNSSNTSSSNASSSNASSSNASSNAFTLTSNPTTSSSSMASKGSSVLKSIKSGIASLLSGNKSKQAQTVAKAKNSKAKAKKPKSPK